MKPRQNTERDDTMSTISSPFTLRPSSRQRRRRRGFSFAEVMFAVIVLGIGFIMVAAIFPVAIQQTRLTVDESTAAAVARQATAVLEQLAAGSEKGTTAGEPLFPSTETGPNQTSVLAFRTQFQVPPSELWDHLRGNLISGSDPRFAWTGLYSRPANSQFIQVYIFVVQSRNESVFDERDIRGPGLVNLLPRQISVDIQPQGSGPEPDGVIIPANTPAFAAEGAYIVTANGAIGAGRVYRLGAYRGPVAGGERYDVDPGYDVPDAPAGRYTGRRGSSVAASAQIRVPTFAIRQSRPAQPWTSRSTRPISR